MSDAMSLMPPDEGERPPPDDMTVKVGWFLLRGPVGIVISLLLGMLSGGVITGYVILELQQPAVFVDALVSRAEAGGMIESVEDLDTGAPVTPTNQNYQLRPGQHLAIHLRPESSSFTWAMEPQGYGRFVKMNLTRSVVHYVAPELTDGKSESVGAITPCRSQGRCDPLFITTSTGSGPAARVAVR